MCSSDLLLSLPHAHTLNSHVLFCIEITFLQRIYPLRLELGFLLDWMDDDLGQIIWPL